MDLARAPNKSCFRHDRRSRERALTPGESNTLATTLVAQAVGVCGRRPWTIIFVFVCLTGAAIAYVGGHFAMDTDSDKLISASLPWRQQQIAVDRAFPQRTDQIIAVVDGATPEAADAATQALLQDLVKRGDAFRSVVQPDGGEFFRKNGLLFRNLADVREAAAQLISAQPFLGTLAADPTLRGVLGALSQGLDGVRRGQAKLVDLKQAFAGIADALERLAAGKDAAFSWRRIILGRTPTTAELRHFLEIQPVLDFNDLEPGRHATEVIREAASRLELTPDKGVTVRLTGPVALADEEFATVADGAALNGVVTILIVIGILYLALRQARIILPVLINLAVGLAITAAVGLSMVGALNLISVAFAVLFVGLGVDFGIQFAVRYREQRHRKPDPGAALRGTGTAVARPLVLAAASITLAFYSFLPTAYRGLSELGLIAGTGMIVALVTTMTLLPALITVFKPRGETADVGFAFLAPLDRFLEEKRNWVVGLTVGAVILGLPLLAWLRFDSNPIDLRSPATESVSTVLDLLRDPLTSPNTIDILESDLDHAAATAKRLEPLPEVDHALTLRSFAPDDQDEKLAAIDDANFFLQDTLNPDQTKPTPTPDETKTAIETTAQDLAKAAGDGRAPGAPEAQRLARALAALGRSTPAARTAAEHALIAPLLLTLDQVRDILSAQHIDVDTLPESLKSDWVAADGRARVEVGPSGDGNDDATLHRFVEAVRAVAPNATGAPVFFVEAAATIVKAFLQAAALSVVAIAAILFLALRRWIDVALTLAPLLIAAIVTLEISVAINLPLNFANIIALPLMLGVGVAFKIYYVMAWRAGETNFLQSSLTRAVFFSACTTATAFGSLWLSHHPGTSSMGELMALSLVTTLCAAVLFQPALLATQRKSRSPAAVSEKL